MTLAALALRRPVTTVAATLALVLLGSVSLGRLPVSLLPDVALPVLTVRTAYPGAAAAEVSRLVAEPVEEAVAATPGLVELRSVSRNGTATTTLRFAWGTRMPATVLQVRERLDNARAALPAEAERPTLLTSDPGERPIAILAVAGPADLRAAARTARDVHPRRLEQLAGIASVAIVGAPEDEIRIDLDPEPMRATAELGDPAQTGSTELGRAQVVRLEDRKPDRPQLARMSSGTARENRHRAFEEARRPDTTAPRIAIESQRS